MSTLAPHTERRAIELLAQCLPYFEQLANLEMTAEDDLDAKQAENCLRRIIKDTNCDLSHVNKVKYTSFNVGELYVLVQRPCIQELMEYDWFCKECYLHQAFGDQKYLDSAYFVPIIRVIQQEE